MMEKEMPSGRDFELEEKIIKYLEKKHEGKATVTSREIYRRFDLTERRSADTLNQMEADESIGMIGERVSDSGWARWELNNDR